jgi:hypothetical protein
MVMCNGSNEAASMTEEVQVHVDDDFVISDQSYTSSAVHSITPTLRIRLCKQHPLLFLFPLLFTFLLTRQSSVHFRSLLEYFLAGRLVLGCLPAQE